MKNWVNYVLTIISALTIYYSFSIEHLGNNMKFFSFLILGWILLIIGLVRIK